VVAPSGRPSGGAAICGKKDFFAALPITALGSLSAVDDHAMHVSTGTTFVIHVCNVI